MTSTALEPRSFPVVRPSGDNEALLGAWKLANQKWVLEETCRAEVIRLNHVHAPRSVVEAAERNLSFAEDRCAEAVELLFDEYRFSLATTHGREAWAS